MAASIGPFATICCEPRQVRKEATVMTDSGAEVRLICAASFEKARKTLMTHQVLARKWRPRTFQEMVGQEHILRMLTHALDSQRLHHAYLFTGTRGVGKTTLGRILAKCLNCETGITSTPCNTCSICKAIDAGNCLDLIEVDAASRTKVEDTRELLDNVQYAPTQGRYKIYLIDEVHMLSNHSFNALLKTLEEPPAHVKFLLATTDPKRLPITILSRCLQFNLRHVPIEKITQHLAHICTTENIVFEIAALQSLAQAADGSMRDALSLLDQAIAFCAGNVKSTETRMMLGCMDQDVIFHLLDALAKSNGSQLLTEITELAQHGPDFNQVLEDVLSTLHQISIAQIVPDARAYSEQIQQFAKTFSAEDIQLYYQIGLIGRRDLPFAPSAHQGFEMMMLRMLAFHPVVAPQTQNTVSAAPSQAAPVASAPLTWTEILSKLPLSGMALALASHCALTRLSDHKIELSLEAKHESLLNKKLVERIEQALIQHLNKSIQLEIKITKTELNTPAQQQGEKQAKRHADATTLIQNNPQVQKIMDVFEATLDPNSITAV